MVKVTILGLLVVMIMGNVSTGEEGWTPVTNSIRDNTLAIREIHYDHSIILDIPGTSGITVTYCWGSNFCETTTTRIGTNYLMQNLHAETRYNISLQDDKEMTFATFNITTSREDTKIPLKYIFTPYHQLNLTWERRCSKLKRYEIYISGDHRNLIKANTTADHYEIKKIQMDRLYNIIIEAIDMVDDIACSAKLQFKLSQSVGLKTNITHAMFYWNLPSRKDEISQTIQIYRATATTTLDLDFEENSTSISYNFIVHPASTYKAMIHQRSTNNYTVLTNIFHTPPVKPIISSASIQCENSQCTIDVNFVHAMGSYLYVFVVDNTNPALPESNPNITQLFALHQSSRSKWVAVEKPITDMKNVKVTVGDGTTSNSKRMGPITNRNLTKSQYDYEVVVVIFNQYVDASIYSEVKEFKKINMEAVSSDGSSWYWLILIPVAVACGLIAGGLWFYMKRRTQSGFHYGAEVEIPLRPPPIEAPKVSRSLSFKAQTGGMALYHKILDLSGIKVQKPRVLTIQQLGDFLRGYDIETDELQDEHEDMKVEMDGAVYENRFVEKNRYANVRPYAATRVKLTRIGESESSEYINASYIKGYSGKTKYIATQGPIKSTISDFWRMIWQENVQLVVMLTNLKEGQTEKCVEYWPTRNSLEFGPMKVFLRSEKHTVDYIQREFELSRGGARRKVIQLHFITWPDKMLPNTPHSFVGFLRYTRGLQYDLGPIVVHCSAGIGRTGAFILCDYILDMAEKTGNVDFPTGLSCLRSCRALMIKEELQYKLCYCIVYEYLRGRVTAIPIADLIRDESVLTRKARLMDDITTIEGTGYWIDVLFYKSEHPSYKKNVEKHRTTTPVRSCTGFVFLKRYPLNNLNSDYINAIVVPDEKWQEKFVATPQPLPNTIGDFWRLADSKCCDVVLSLHELVNNDKTSTTFWPTSQTNPLVPVDFLKLQLIEYSDKKSYDMIRINMSNTDSETQKQVTLLHFKSWKKDELPKIEDFLGFVDAFTRLSSESTIISCYDGSKGCSLLLTYLHVLEKVKMEKVFDICSVVRTLRIYRDDFMTEETSFKFIYEAIAHYQKNIDGYEFPVLKDTPLYQNLVKESNL